MLCDPHFCTMKVTNLNVQVSKQWCARYCQLIMKNLPQIIIDHNDNNLPYDN